MTFHVGQKVVCVDDGPDPQYRQYATRPWLLDGLRKSTVYTVREVGLVSWLDHRPCIRLEEIRRPGDPPDCPYWAHRFRPVTERKTDISVFKEMLTKAPNEMETVDGR